MLGKKTWLYVLLGVSCSFTVQAQTSFAPLAEKLIPSVVNISTQQQDTEDEPEILNDLLFATPEGRVALGSGFILSSDGYIVTNQHVIEKARKISVIAADNQEYEAQVIGADVKTDVAVIKINPQEALVPVEFGNSDEILVGDWILAIGNPFGLGSSVTAGIISAKSRDIDSGPYDNYLQTDASINQGNSGGPMFNMEGKLIGINTAIFSTMGNSVGVGFALPINQATWIINQLRQHGKVTRSWLGILVKPTTVDNSIKGLAVSAFKDESLAVQNELQVGDVILAVDEMPITSSKDFSFQIAQMPAGKELSLKVWRNGEIAYRKVRTYLLSEEEKVDIAAVAEPENIVKGEDYPEFGLKMDGLKVLEVKQGSEAEAKGIKAGDMIKKINGSSVFTVVDFQRYVQDALLSKEVLHFSMEDELNAEGYFVDLVAQKVKNE